MEIKRNRRPGPKPRLPKLASSLVTKLPVFADSITPSAIFEGIVIGKRLIWRAVIGVTGAKRRVVKTYPVAGPDSRD